MKYIRTCQECGYKQECRDPKEYADKLGKEAWRNTKCRKCKSESLDYGSWQED